MRLEPLPPRAAIWLPPLPPEDGLRRESLVSLSRRTAETNQIPISTFVTGVLLPGRNWNGGSISQLHNHVHRVNGESGLGVEWGTALSSLVHGIEHARYTTRVAGAGDFRPLVCSRYRKWCPECYEADARQPWGPYERLLWSVDSVSVCVMHKRPLHTVCPHCLEGPFHVMAHRDESGCCPNCREWLATETPLLRTTKEEYLMSEWCARALAYLIEAPPPGEDVQVRKNVSLILTELAKYHGLNAKSLGSLLRRPPGTVSSWLAGKYAPSTGGLLSISFAFHVPLQDLLIGDRRAIGASAMRNVPKALGSKTKGKAPTRLSNDALNLLLDSLRCGHHPNLISLVDAARFLDVSAKHLRQKAPPKAYSQLSALIRKQKAAWIAERRAVRAAAIDRAVELIAVAAARRGEPIKRRSLGAELAARGLPRPGPDEWLLYKRAQQIYDHCRAAMISSIS
jgi:hypothetical protein